MKSDLETLKQVKLTFDIHSDQSTMCNGYRSLCRMIEEAEKEIEQKEANRPPYDSYYYTADELKEIETWDTKDAYNLIEKLRAEWQYKSYFIEKWGLDHIHKERPVLMLELHTGGWSGNEDIIEALERQKFFWMMWWWKTVKIINNNN